MSTTSHKQEILQAVQELPDGASIEDAIERLCFLAKVERGLAQSDAGQTIPHEEVRKRLLRK
jgi:predicted transcriptional regulator